jgi:magnesium transporter
VVLRLGRREFALVPAEDAFLFRDVHDHLVRINDLLENFREMLGSIQDAYLSVTSNRTNEIMKFLTLFTSTLMPLTVITGIYGMNFDHMPELRWLFGYPGVLLVMMATTGTMLTYFWHRGWLGRPSPLEQLPDGTEAALIPKDEQPAGDGRSAP